MKEALATVEEGVLDTSMENRANPTWISDLLQDRPRLIELLTDFSHASPRQELLIQHLAEKNQKGIEAPLHDVLRRITMSRLEFYTIIKSCRTTKSEFRTGQILDIFRPKVTKAVMEGALPQISTCDKCLGEGTITKKKEEVQCWKCKGEGTISRQPEHERQITALQISGVLQKNGPGTVVNVNNAVDNSIRSSPEFRRDTDKLMYASVVDTTSVPSPQALPESTPTDSQGAASDTAREATTPGTQTTTVAQTPASPLGSLEKAPVVLVGKPLGKRRGGKSSVQS